MRERNIIKRLRDLAARMDPHYMNGVDAEMLRDASDTVMDMKAALEACLERIYADLTVKDHRALLLARKAIAKAEGRK